MISGNVIKMFLRLPHLFGNKIEYNEMLVCRMCLYGSWKSSMIRYRTCIDILCTSQMM